MTFAPESARRLKISHATRYKYAERVSLSYHQAMLKPRHTAFQQVQNSYLHVEPQSPAVFDRDDYFGNRVSTFEIDSSHTSLDVVAETQLLLAAADLPNLFESLPLEEIRARLGAPRDVGLLSAAEFLAESPLIPRSAALAKFGRTHFPPGRPYLEGVRDLMQQIFQQFRYDPQVTNVSTPVSEVLAHKHGVCQDFAHLMIACLRSLGGPARYVSGYLIPLPGVVGAQASHAWVSAYCPNLGWVDFDPTNNVIPVGGHVTLAWGRDFSDVSPLRGVIFGGGDHTVHVEVSIT